MWMLSFDMTDYQSSVTVRKYTEGQEALALQNAITPGMWLRVQGQPELTRDGKDIQLKPYHIMKVPHEGRKDTAPEKRVELHLHTKMSNMDALTDTASVIKQAISWGHPAIAITDHGVASPSRMHGTPPRGRSRSSTAWRGIMSTTSTTASPSTVRRIRILPTRSCASTSRPRA